PRRPTTVRARLRGEPRLPAGVVVRAAGLRALLLRRLLRPAVHADGFRALAGLQPREGGVRPDFRVLPPAARGRPAVGDQSAAALRRAARRRDSATPADAGQTTG